MLNKEQSKYIYQVTNRIYTKYFSMLPFSQETWNELTRDCNEINNKIIDKQNGRKNKDIESILMELIKYFEVLNAHTKE